MDNQHINKIQVLTADVGIEGTYTAYQFAQALVQGMAERCFASIGEKAGCYALDFNGTLVLAIRLFPYGPDEVSQSELMDAVRLKLYTICSNWETVDKNYQSGVDWQFLEGIVENG